MIYKKKYYSETVYEFTLSKNRTKVLKLYLLRKQNKLPFIGEFISLQSFLMYSHDDHKK